MNKIKFMSNLNVEEPEPEQKKRLDPEQKKELSKHLKQIVQKTIVVEEEDSSFSSSEKELKASLESQVDLALYSELVVKPKEVVKEKPVE